MVLDQGWIPHPLRLPQNSEEFDSRIFQGLHFSNLARWSEPRVCDRLRALCLLCLEHPESCYHTASGTAGQKPEHAVAVGNGLGVGDRAVALPLGHQLLWGITHKTGTHQGFQQQALLHGLASPSRPQETTGPLQTGSEESDQTVALSKAPMTCLCPLHSSVMLRHSLVCMFNHLFSSSVGVKASQAFKSSPSSQPGPLVPCPTSRCHSSFSSTAMPATSWRGARNMQGALLTSGKAETEQPEIASLW